MTPRTRFVFFLGPTCVGKGFIMKLLKDFIHLIVMLRLIRVGIISFGDIVKGLLETDPKFKAKYGEPMSRGELVDDPKAIEIFQKEVDRLMAEQPHFILVDGFCRSVPQIKYAHEKGYLARAKIFMIEASIKTCLNRFLHRKANASRQRIDAEMETFYQRYHLHASTAPKLREMFRECDGELIDINGEPDIVNHVAGDIKYHLVNDILAAARSEVPKHQSVA